MNDAPTHWYKKWWGIALLLVLVVIFSLFFALLLLTINYIKNPPPSDMTEINAQKTLNFINNREDAYWIGSAKPKITIVEFSDFACPYCLASFPKIREISTKYKNDVKIIYRYYPVTSEYSIDLALSAECAGEQGLFWLMHDQLFLNQGVSERQELINLAKRVGADVGRFTACYDTEKYLDRITVDLEAGQNLKIAGTPSWFINGQKIEGDIPREYFFSLIDGLLK